VDRPRQSALFSTARRRFRCFAFVGGLGRDPDFVLFDFEFDGVASFVGHQGDSFDGFAKGGGGHSYDEVVLFRNDHFVIGKLSVDEARD